MASLTQTEAQLIIRARQIGAETIDAVSAKLAVLNQRLAQQAAAAATGEASTKDLETTLKSLKQLGEQFINTQVGQVAEYERLAGILAKVTDTADAARAKQQAMATAQANAATVTKQQTDALEKLTTKADAADRRVATATASLNKQGEAIKRLGGDLNNLAATDERVAETFRNISAAATATETILDGYEAHLAKVRAGEASLAEIDAFGKKVQDAANLERVNQRLADFEEALRSAEEAEKEFARFQPTPTQIEDFNKQREEIVQRNLRTQAEREFAAALDATEAAQRKQQGLTAFRQQGADALAAAGDLNVLTTTQKTATASAESLAAAIQAILDPSAAARTTLAGLEGEIARVGTEIGDAKKPIGDYQDALRDLDRIKSALDSDGKLIDQYRAQAAAVDELTTTYQNNLRMVRERSQAILAADNADEKEIALLHDQEAALAASSSQLVQQTEKLNTMGASLDRAGIDTNKLTDAENRLRTASVGTAASVQKLQVAASGKGTTLGGIFGLKPYELQNLGYQANDVVTQIASGTPILQVFTQQAGQILQIRGVLSGIIAYAPAILVVVATLGTLFLAFKRIYDLAQDTREFTRQLAFSTDGAIYNTKALTANAQALRDLGLSSTEARDAIKGFIAAGLDPTKIEAFSKAALDFSRITGVALPEALKLVTTAFTGGYAAIVKLDDAYHFLSAAQRQQIRDDYDSANGAKGRTDAFNIFAAKTQEVADKARGDWAEALHLLGNNFRAFIELVANSRPIQEWIAWFAELGAITKFVAEQMTRITGATDALRNKKPPPPSDDAAKNALNALVPANQRDLQPGQKRVVAATGAVGIVGSPTDDTIADTPEKQAQGQDYVTDAKRARDAAMGLNDEQIILNAGIAKYNDAVSKNLGEQYAKQAQIIEQDKTRFTIGKQRLEQEQQLASQLKSSVIAAGQADDNNLGARLAGVRAALDLQLKSVSDARARGETGIPGMGGLTLDGAEKIFRAQAGIIAQQTTMTFYESQLNDKQKTYTDLVNAATAAHAAGSITAIQASDKVKAAQDAILPSITAVAKKAVEFATALYKASPSPKTEAYLAKVSSAADDLVAKGTTDRLKLLTDDVTAAQAALNDSLANIQKDFNEKSISGAEAIERADKAQASLTPRIVTAAQAAEDLAKSLNSLHPTPQLGAQVDKFAGIADHAGDSNPKTSAVGKLDTGVVNTKEQELNQIIADRNALVETYKALVTAGVLDEADAEAKTKAAFEDAAPAINAQITEITGLINTLRSKDGANIPLLDALTAKLQLAGAQAVYVDKDVAALGKTIDESIANQAVTAFDSAGQAIGNAVAGTESWGNALDDLGRASANFFAGLLKDIAEAIIKMEILSALGIKDGGAGSASSFGSSIAAALLGSGGGGAAAFSGASAGASAGGSFFTAAAVLHNGTEGGPMRRSGLDPALWVGAPRYHTGTAGVGLSANEEAAILKDGEAVLTEADPYHPKNRGKLKGGAAGGAAPSLKQILLLDPKDVQGVMAAPGGVDVVLTILKSNAQTVKQILGSK